VILTDTVGFIRDLPHKLINAFHATLEETVTADLLLWVIDANDPFHHEKREEVRRVLEQIHADHIPCIEVYNKIDLLTDSAPHCEIGNDEHPTRVWLSAAKQLGLDLLRETVENELQEEVIYRHITLSPSQAKLRAQLYEQGSVLEERIDEAGNSVLRLRLTRRNQCIRA
jgi:GTP-binding protein HflX